MKKALPWLAVLLLLFANGPAKGSASGCPGQTGERTEVPKVVVESVEAKPCPMAAKKSGLLINMVGHQSIQDGRSDASWVTVSQARSLLESGAKETVLFVGTGFNDDEIALQCARLLPSCSSAQCMVLKGGFAKLAENPVLSASEALAMLLKPETSVRLESAAPLSSELSRFVQLAGRANMQVAKRADRLGAPQALWLAPGNTSVKAGEARYAITGGQDGLMRAFELHHALRNATYQTPKLPCYLAH